ncbi:hypothetical protein [Limosilactobacillus mucosae]|uniref:hypothetical protein n=1 Tax=Limosilactobacillus mucosae TaxID=97478 RepID=UPI0009BB2CD1|nr:hypothetical protein [Limosilactobacillus mucosae]
MKKVKNSLMAILMIFSMTFLMAGCGNSSKSAQSSSKSETTSSKVVKKKNATKAKKVSTSSSKSKTSSSKAESEYSSSSAVVDNESQSSNSSSSSAQSSSNIQLGLNDVATWTDSNGVVHNVDSDGMDRQVKNGQTTYADWSGPLPSNAQVVTSSSSSSVSN